MAPTKQSEKAGKKKIVDQQKDNTDPAHDTTKLTETAGDNEDFSAIEKTPGNDPRMLTIPNRSSLLMITQKLREKRYHPRRVPHSLQELSSMIGSMIQVHANLAMSNRPPDI